ncbi:MAG: hypothetical protein HY342_00975 [Candidatus Lambdaproteobacteria bacterium]|nr:hypothetical protein [Candidatus Lambdaproteobacteria bacterium]
MAEYRGGSQPPHMWRGTSGRSQTSGPSRAGGGKGGSSATVVIVVIVVIVLVALSLYLGASR